MASASSSKDRTESTGPKTSPRATSMSGRTASRTVGGHIGHNELGGPCLTLRHAVVQHMGERRAVRLIFQRLKEREHCRVDRGAGPVRDFLALGVL
jgi:hypothetical protein